MAECLVYNRPEFCNDDKNTYPDRYSIGDVVDIKPDGFWTKSKRECGPAFKVVAIPGKVEELRYLLNPYEDKKDEEQPVLLKRREKTIDISALESKELIVERVEDLTIIDNTVVRR